MATFSRSSLPDFATANPFYAGATVTVYEVDDDGESTGVLATLYQAPTGSAEFSNPLRLDGEGKWQHPVYVDQAVTMQIVRPGYPSATHWTGVVLSGLSIALVNQAEAAARRAIAFSSQLSRAARAAKAAAVQAAAYAASINPAQFVLKAGDTMTGVLQFIAGTALAPGVTPATDGDTGLFSLGLNRLNLGAGGVDILEVQTAALGTRAHLQVKKNAAGTTVALADGVTITPDFSTGNHFDIGPLAGNRTLANPTNMVPGQSGVMIVRQDATGNRALTFGSWYKFPGGVAALSTSGSAIDTLSYFVVDASTIFVSVANDWR